MELDKICRTCMGFTGPLLSIYDGGTAATGTANCIAEMLSDVTKIKPKRGDNLPEKVCLSCISEINRCYSYKMKVENSNRTLRQLIPQATPEDYYDRKHLIYADKSIQTINECVKEYYTSETQTESDTILNEYEPENEKDQESETNELIAECLNECLKTIKTEKASSKKNIKQLSITQFKRNSIEVENEKIKSDITEQEAEEIVAANDNQNESFNHRDSMQPEDGKLKSDIDDHQENEEIVESNDHQNESFNDPNIYEIYEEYVLDDEQISKEQQEYNQENGVEEEQNDFIKLCSEDESSEKSNISEADEEDENQIEYNISICNETDESKALKDDTVFKATKYQCPNCVMSFVSIKNLNKHVSKRHCVRIAQAVLNTDSNLNDTPEIEILKDVKKAKVSYASPKDTEVYEPPPRILKTEPQPMEYSCEQCKASFALKKSLLYHYRLNACSIKSFPCNECRKVFNTEQNLEEHKSTHILSNNCNECSKVFPTKEELSQHMLDSHNRKARNQCNVCMKVFTMLSTLKDHMRIHTGEKPFICTVCNKGFTQNANLKQHMLRHSDNKPFKCDECPKSYCTRAEYYSHKRTHTGDQPFRCDFCDARFTTNSSMVKHRRKHTGERPYACDLCPMRFSSSNVLKNHRRTHTGEKPFKCSYCPKVFAQKGDCQNHQRIHSQTTAQKLTIAQKRKPIPRTAKLEKEFVSEDEYQEVSGDDGEVLSSENEVVLMEIDIE